MGVAADRRATDSKAIVPAIITLTNTAENYLSILKRGLIGSFHHVSEASFASGALSRRELPERSARAGSPTFVIIRLG
jgi:hypothetical protein